MQGNLKHNSLNAEEMKKENIRQKGSVRKKNSRGEKHPRGKISY